MKKIYQVIYMEVGLMLGEIYSYVKGKVYTLEVFNKSKIYIQYLSAVSQISFLRFCHVDFFSYDKNVFFS